MTTLPEAPRTLRRDQPSFLSVCAPEAFAQSSFGLTRHSTNAELHGAGEAAGTYREYFIENAD